MRRELARRDARIQDLEDSTSWRVTKPARLIADALRSRFAGPNAAPRVRGDHDDAEVDAEQATVHETELIEPSAPQLFPPGHYYSPIVDVDDIKTREEVVFAAPSSLPGIDLRTEEQLSLLPRIVELCEDHPYNEKPGPGSRYGFDNDFFSYGDALVLHAMLRMINPSRYIEVGSGWSSALALDVIDQYLGGHTMCTFVEPYPDRLHRLLRDGDESSRVAILEEPLYKVDRTIFESLQAGDILFIDSTHVSRAGSDVNNLYLEVLPQLKPGVIVHVHDIFYPFEYPREWVYQGRNWNESYLLRAYLINNPRMRILWYNSYLAAHHRGTVAEQLPLWDRNPGGSIWLEVSA